MVFKPNRMAIDKSSFLPGFQAEDYERLNFPVDRIVNPEVIKGLAVLHGTVDL